MSRFAASLVRASSVLWVLLLTAAPASASGPVLDDRPTRLVVNGYSTSFNWPRLLAQQLDERLGEDRVEVVSAVEAGSPIVRWINPATGRRTALYERKLKPALQSDRRVVVLAQQSLQGVFGRRFAGIRGEDDAKRIEQGADALQTYADALLADGADLVVIAMHIYKRPQEPAIGNERLALERLLARKPERVLPGPDVWTPTSRGYPELFAADGMHPNARGSQVMADAWLARLLAAPAAEGSGREGSVRGGR